MLVAAGDIYGPALIGCIVTALLYGIACAQTCRYYIAFREDPGWLKLAVGILWYVVNGMRTEHVEDCDATVHRLLDTLHNISVTGSVYFYLINNREAQSEPGSARLWTDGAVIMISHISNTITRCIMLSKIYHLSNRSLPLLAVLGTVAATASGFGIFYGAVSTTASPFQASRIAQWVLYAGLSCEAAADVAITITLCIYFARLRAAVETSHPLMNKLLLYTVCSGMLPSAIALASLISYALYPQTFIFIGIFFPLPEACLNSMLATLNVRTKLRRVLPGAKLKMAEKQLHDEKVIVIPRRGIWQTRPLHLAQV
ncbi:hypothetical protein NM688_g2147 [Phlebia brevispora]|uniref:Uncharacterized protein n=1 Tax=Phlebia brevispora TaxID=194682 RepID=A0ACC1T9P8_9APHY|nr:hypothetical protein NM688_g2147 [Phlebia brevispora]